MKRVFISISLIALVGCASKKPVVVQMPHWVPGTAISAENLESIRYGENLKAYPISRYVDPNNQLVMHESNTVYRVETTAKWNLHPNAPVSVPSGPVVQIIDPARKDSPVTPEIIAEINRQKDATKALITQGSRMNRELMQLSTNVSAARQVVVENAKLKQQLVSTVERLEALQDQFRKQQAETLSNRTVSLTETNGW
jgi:hypothetical protein